MKSPNWDPTRTDFLFVLVGGLVTAVVCFGVLESAATISTAGTITGALAGAVGAWLVLARIFRSLRVSRSQLDAIHDQTAKELSRLRDENEVLRQKLLRGAPAPAGFEIEVDERNKLVLARPAQWQSRGGLLFDFEEPGGFNDPLPARFMVEFNDVATEYDDPMDFYRSEIQAGNNLAWRDVDYIHVGGEGESIASMRVFGSTFYRIRSYVEDLTGQVKRNLEEVPREEFDAELERFVDETLARVVPSESDTNGDLVPDQLRETLVHEVRVAVNEAGEVPTFGALLANGTMQTWVKELSEGKWMLSDAAVQGLEESRTGSLRVEIVPAASITVVTYCRALKRVFFFRVTDNATEFGSSTAQFNRTLASVRFLQ